MCVWRARARARVRSHCAGQSVMCEAKLTEYDPQCLLQLFQCEVLLTYHSARARARVCVCVCECVCVCVCVCMPDLTEIKDYNVFIIFAEIAASAGRVRVSIYQTRRVCSQSQQAPVSLYQPDSVESTGHISPFSGHHTQFVRKATTDNEKEPPLKPSRTASQ